MRKTLVCDSSSLISLAETCTLGVLSFLQDKFGVDFVIPPAVQAEIVERPRKVGRYSYSAARINHLLNQGTVRVASNASVYSDAEKIMDAANSLFYAEKPLKIIQQGEAQCLALLSPLQAKALLIDEKTTRLLIEDAKKLFFLMQAEHGETKTNEKTLSYFQKRFAFPAMRSTELVAFAAQNGFFESYAPDENEVFHSSIYALRYAGCSISQKEIDDYQKIKV
ncbi:MAG: hypothetical protein QXR53_02705 [Candidatus Norongarragalinales archaeon]